MKKRVVAFLLAAAMVAGNCASDLSHVQAASLTDGIVDDNANADSDADADDDVNVGADDDADADDDANVGADDDADAGDDTNAEDEEIIDADDEEQKEEDIEGEEELDVELSDQDELSEEEEEAAWKASCAEKYNLSEEELENLFEDINEWFYEEDMDKQDELYAAMLESYALSEDDFANISYMYISRYEDPELEEESWLDRFKTAVVSFFTSSKEPTYAGFIEDEVIADFAFGSDITTSSVYDEAKGYGFSKVEFPNAAAGWVSNVYYPRVESVTKSDASYVSDVEGALAISSKVWTETESTGYGVYTYENTSTFDYDLYNADYEVTVTFVNPTGSSYNAYVEAEDITKASGIEVAAGETKAVKFTSCLVDGQLNLKFLGSSAATTESAAATQAVYVSNVKITRLATNAAREDGKPTIFIASDSTVQSYDSYYYPQTGWGQVLAEFFGDHDYQEVTSATAGYSQSKTYEVSNAVVENRAIGGRSSSSFVLEGKLDDLLEDVRPGDYVLVQWGHNDSTYSRPNRYVSSSDFEKWMQIYVDGAIERGATPILVTPVARYSYSTDSEGKLISYASNFEAYRQVMIKMSMEQGIALVDLTQRSIDVANSFGIDGGKSLWLYTNAGDYPGGAYAGGSTDSTHLQWYGAYKFAQCVATGIVEAGNSTVYTNENNASSENKAALASLAKLVDLRAAETAPKQITGLTLGTIGASSVAMSWNPDNESEMYYIYRAEVDSAEEGASYQFSDSDKKYSVSRNAKYTDTGCESGKTYVYAIRGYNSLGLGEFSDAVVVTTKSAGLRFDFNYNNSATQAGWIGINQNQAYDSELGYGWITAPNNGRSRGNNGTVGEDLADMAGDFCLGAGEFAVNLPNGDYEITIYAADLLSGTSTIKPSYTAEGAAFGGISCKQSLGSVTGTVRVTDGQLNIVVGGTNQYINGMTITEILKAPTNLVETEASVSGSTYTALLSFNGVEEAAGYNYYIKGSTDADFKLERTFDKEKYALGVTEYGAISVKLGENYDYYVTCYTADGTESAPSNTVTVTAQLDVATPAAPQNVVCKNPTESTEGVQNTITISWDASEVVDSTYPVLKYIVYRSDKAESDKGFKEFEKVGETTTTTFTDNSEGIATNISYYYKVCASNAGGAGELSEACKTPVTGKLVAGSRENLTDRALTAVKLSKSVKAIGTDGNEITEGVYLSWRAFEEEFDAKNNLTTTFTIKVNGTVVKENLKATNVVLTNVDDTATFTVEGSADKSVNGGLKVIETKAWDNQYIEMQLYKPADETMPDGSTCNFTANDMSVGDVDADGQLELIVKWYPSNAKDNSGAGYTGKTFLDTYDVDWNTGAVALLSRIDLGINIRSGAHYTQFQVWDFDADGKAEIAVKTADGSTIYKSTDGTDATLTFAGHVGACKAEDLPTDVVSEKNDYRNGSGYVLSGPEYFTMFNPEEGTILDTVDYIPARGTVSKWGDAYGNRVDRFLSATAYLDGVHPFAVMCRGYYTRTALTAYGTKDTDEDGIGDKIYTYWAYDTDNGDGPEGQGHHNLTVGDVDNDGKDEIVYGSSCYDHDGTLKYSTGFGHGDAMHLSDWVSWNDGMELMTVHEEWNQTYQVEIHDAETGEVIIGYPVKNTDVGRGVAEDIDPTSKGAEFWASSGPSGEGTGEWDSIDSSVIGTEHSGTTAWDVLSLGSTPAVNATLYWDGDLLAEIQDHVFNNKNGNYYPVSTFIAKWNYEKNVQEKILSTDEIFTSNGTKGNLGLIADLTGDWRDEFIARCSADDSKIRLYTTTYVTDYVIPCALDDLQYREGVAWENVGYNQPTHTSYLVSKGLVTAQLSKGTMTANSAEILFTPANDGDLYGHDITAYEIYRDGNLIDTVGVKDLVKKTISGDEVEEKEEEPEIIGYDENTIYSFDIGTKRGTADGFIGISNNAYNTEKGYGFSEDTVIADYAGKGTCVAATEEAISVACTDVAFANGTATFLTDVKAGTYRVDVYAGSLGGAADTTIAVNGENLGTVVGTTGTTAESMLKSATVTMENAGQISVVSHSDSGARALLSAIVITELTPIYAEPDEEENGDESEKQYETIKHVLWSANFEDGTSNFTTISADPVIAADKATEYPNTSANILSILGATRGGRGTYDNTLSISDDAVIEFDVRLEADNVGQEEVFTLLGDVNTDNWLTSTSQILTLKSGALSTGKNAIGMIDFVSVNGVDITEKAVVTTGNIRIANNQNSQLGSKRDTTGWLHVLAKLNFEEQTINITITRNSNSEVIYANEELPFASENSISSVESVYLAAGKGANGAVSVDNMEIYTTELVEIPNEEADSNTVFSYTDKNLSSNTTYSYQIAAVVDGKTSFLSRAVKVKTLIRVAEVVDFELDPIVAGTEVKESVAELLPTTVKVIDEENVELDAPITWDVSEVDINTVGEYTVTGTVAGYSEKIVKTLKIIANELKGIATQDAVVVIVGNTATLPSTVDVEYTNGKKDTVAVTWDTTAVDYNTIGVYDVTGAVEGYEDKATITIKVVADYAVSVATTFIEIAVGTSIVEALPETVLATMASGKKDYVPVTWKTEGVDAIDTSKPSEQMIHGTVENLDADILCDVTVTYPALYKFDFGISNSVVADGWTTITVNAKGGKKTVAELGNEYTAEKGYGFTNPDAVIEGRTESVEGTGVYPTNVVTDFALMTGQTFVVDVPNGEYLVQVMTNCGIGSTSATVEVEGTSASFNANKSFTVKDYTVTVEDGQLTIVDKSTLSRIGAIVVRTITSSGDEGDKDPDKTVICDHDKVHNLTTENTEATCTADAVLREHYYCAECDKYFADAEGTEELTMEECIAKALGHKAVYHDAVDATAEADGNIAYVSCENCGKLFADDTFEKELSEEEVVVKYVPTDSGNTDSGNSGSGNGSSGTVDPGFNTPINKVITSISDKIETVKENVANTVTEVVNTVANAITDFWNRITGRGNRQNQNAANTTVQNIAEEQAAVEETVEEVAEAPEAVIEDNQTPLADNSASVAEENVSIEDEQAPTSANAGFGATAAAAGGIGGLVLLAAALVGFAYAKSKKKEN